MEVAYQIDGRIGDQLVDGRGAATIDVGKGSTLLDVEFRSRPAGWDPKTIILCCCSCTLALPARQLSGARNLLALSGGEVSIGHELPGALRSAVVVGEGGGLLAQVSASSRTNIAIESPFDHSTIEGGYCDMEPGQRGIDQFLGVNGLMIPVGPQLVNVVTVYQIRLEDGSFAHGTTTYPYFLPKPVAALDAAQSFELRVADCTFQGNVLRALVETTVSKEPFRMETSRLDDPRVAA